VARRDPARPGAPVEGRDGVLVVGDHQGTVARHNIGPPPVLRQVEHRIAFSANNPVVLFVRIHGLRVTYPKVDGRSPLPPEGEPSDVEELRGQVAIVH
jgi:hypothetical protein